ncbi:hypothetical protein ACUYGA_30680 [Metapseudomonas otitidis]|uniref:hypothetical protein n=1 Tax=Metapseudomonas otitidis TaxID=319939 RepID=UPI0040559748
MRPEQPCLPEFIPLQPDEPEGLLGFRSDATAMDLYDAAMKRQEAVLGVLEAVSGAPIHEMSNQSLQCFINALRLLTSDSIALHKRAFKIFS